MPSDPSDANGEPQPNPIPAPPLIPPAIPEDAPPIIPDPISKEGRLHPLSLIFRFWQTIKSIILPAIIFIAFGNERILGFIMLFLVVIPLIVSVVRYFTFTYRIEDGELIIRHGLLGRTERNIPLTRVQDIRIEQGVLHRLFKMADVQVETAGSQGPEASLSVLSVADADRLRKTIFLQTPGKTKEQSGEETAELKPEVIRKVTMDELIIAGLTSNKLASVLAMIVLAERLSHNFIDRDRYEKAIGSFVGQIEHWFQSVGDAAWITAILGGIALLLVGMIVSVFGSIINFYGFTLSRLGEDLHRAYGLITRRSSSLPRSRIQVLQVEEKMLRRMCKMATLRADTAGSRAPNERAQSSGRDVLLPIVPRAEVNELLPIFFANWSPAQSVWQQVSRRAIYRGTVKGVFYCLIISGICVLNNAVWHNLWPLIFCPFIYILNVMAYKHLGYELREDYFRTRRGWLSRATHIVPVRNTQCVVLKQNPFDRRHRVRTVSVDTAGQAYTGGGPQIDNVPEEEALKLARTIAHKAAATRYRWSVT